jgi:hypothetical protein
MYRTAPRSVGGSAAETATSAGGSCSDSCALPSRNSSGDSSCGCTEERSGRGAYIAADNLLCDERNDSDGKRIDDACYAYQE